MVANLPAMNQAIDPSGIRLNVVLYLRKSPSSKGDIELSVDQQRKACHEFAQRNGWIIVGEFLDEGKSGSRDIDLRKAFHEMIKEAKSPNRDWQAILCWDNSRFSRQDPLDAAEYKCILRDNGVWIETVTEGKTEWTTSNGRMQDAWRSEQNHEYSVKMGKQSVRGREGAIDAGFWPHGAIPFGFDRQYFSGGKAVSFQNREVKAERARGWKLKLVVREEEAKIVQWMYESYANKDMSLRQIGRELTMKGFLTPKGGRGGWNCHTVQDVLRNPIYCGDMAIGYNRRWRLKKVFTRSKQTLMKDAVDPIIDRQTWEVVQQKMKQRKEAKRQVHSGKVRTSPLSGIVICGHCGYRCDYKTRQEADGVRRGYFTCSSPQKRPLIKCHQWRAVESEIVPVVMKKLVEAVDFNLLQTLQAVPPKQEDTTRENVKKQIADLKRKIDKGADNLLQADSSVFTILQQRLTVMRDELKKLENTIQIAEESTPDEWTSISRWWNKVKPSLVTVKAGEPKVYLAEANGSAKIRLKDIVDCLPLQAEPAVIRDLLHKLNARLILHWTRKGVRNFTLDTGLLKVDLDSHLLCAVSTGASHKVQKVKTVEILIRFTEEGVTGSSRNKTFAYEGRTARLKAAKVAGR